MMTNNNTLNQFIGWVMDLKIKPMKNDIKQEGEKLSLLKDNESYSVEAIDEYIDKLQRAIDGLKELRALKIDKVAGV